MTEAEKIKRVEEILKTHLAAAKERMQNAMATYHAKGPDDFVYGQRGLRVGQVLDSCREQIEEAEELLSWWTSEM